MKTTTRDAAIKKRNGLPPIHPGEIIKQDILPSVGLSVTATARALGVSRQMLHAILAGRKPLSAVMCLRVARLFGGSPELWMDLQATFDLKKSMQNKKVMQGIARIVPLNGIEEARA
jgi:addiction module HigA family antidote